MFSNINNNINNNSIFFLQLNTFYDDVDKCTSLFGAKENNDFILFLFQEEVKLRTHNNTCCCS